MLSEYQGLFLLSFFLGITARGFMLRIDYRQFPSFPHSYLIHLTMGLIASVLGSITLPVLLEKEFIAITFLTLAAQHFREVRNMERESLNRIEESELIPKGAAYVEGIAKLFEARNYLAFLTALVTGIFYYIFSWFPALIGGSLTAYLLHLLMKGPLISDIARIEIVPLTIEGYNIGVEEVIIMNVGEAESLEKWKEEGIGIKIIPRDENARATLVNLGQRQAILHDLSTLMGVKLDKGMQQYTPLARLQIDKGVLNIIIVPQEPDKKYIKQAIKKIPVLESSQRKPLKSKSGQKAAD
ncbi:MAG: YIEGIA family protein [Halanaerobiaceae bacterium]